MQTRSKSKLSNPPSTSTRQTKPAKAKKVNSSSKIDRLSNLPNELLDLIFDYAYPLDSPSTGPLSKHLLPYHITGLYRRVELEGPDAIIKFVEKINGEPELGSLVRCAHLTTVYEGRIEEHWVSEEDTYEFFSNLVNLQELNLGDRFHEAFGYVSHGDLDLIPSEYLPLLRHLEIAGIFHIIDFTDYETLVSLTVTGDHEADDPYIHLPNVSSYSETDPPNEIPLFENLKSLYISGLHYNSPQLLPHFLAIAPNLQKLDLDLGSYVDEDNRLEWSESIARLPSHFATQVSASLDEAIG